MPALLCALLATPPSWAQTLKAPGAGAGPRLGGAAAPATPGAQLPSEFAPALPSTSTSTSSSQRIRPIDAIVAVVNNEVITAHELDLRMQTVEARLRSQGGSVPPQAQFRQQLLERMIVDRAQLQLAKESGLRVDDPLLDAAVARIAEQNNLTMADFAARSKATASASPASERTSATKSCCSACASGKSTARCRSPNPKSTTS